MTTSMYQARRKNKYMENYTLTQEMTYIVSGGALNSTH